MDVGSMVDKIQSYSKVLKQHGFRTLDCGGKKPWSHRATNDILFVDTRNSEWTAYNCASDIEMACGPDPETLANYLAGNHKTGAGI